MTGSGKTVLARHLVESALAQVETTFAYFFSFSELGFNLANVFVASLISQIIRSKEISAKKSLLTELRTLASIKRIHFKPTDCPLNILLGIAERLFAMLDSFTLVIDALDECVADCIPSILSMLRLIASREGVKIVMFSRDRSDIRKNIGPKASILTLDPARIHPDLLRFAENEISVTSKLERSRAQILKQIDTCAHGSFLWTAFLIMQLKTALNTRDLMNILISFPPELAAVYRDHVYANDARFTEKEKKLRHSIFLLLVGFKKLPSADEISDFIAINCNTNTISDRDVLFDVADRIESICWPWIAIDNSDSTVNMIHTTVKEFLLNHFLSVDNAKSKQMSDLYLAEKCLSILSQEKYRMIEYPARLLREHLIGKPDTAPAKKTVFSLTSIEPRSYNYACLHWQDHLLAISDPPLDLLKQLSRFLSGPEFVSWSEVFFELVGPKGIAAHVDVYSRLEDWHGRLDPDKRLLVPIKDYFVEPHKKLSSELAERQGDKLVPLLPLQRLGDFYNMRGQTPAEQEKSFKYREAVAQGFEELLGPENPLSLRAQTKFLAATMVRFQLEEASAGLEKVSQVQLRVLGDTSVDYLTTREAYATTLYYMTYYEEAFSIYENVGRALGDVLGVEDPFYLFIRLETGYTFEARGLLDEAISIYRQVLGAWEAIAGSEHPLALYIQCAYGSALRKVQRMIEAQDLLFLSWGGRQRLFKENNRICLDSAIQLAVALREAKKPQEAAGVLDSIAHSTVFDTDFERTCQVKHLKSLLQFDEGQYAEPRRVLLDLIEHGTGKNRQKSNRSLLWVRVDLSDVLRERAETDLASMLYSDLVEPSTGHSNGESADDLDNLNEEPDPPKFLAVAEQAIRLIKEAKNDAARELLTENGLQWKRPKDFWIFMGGPIADTARMTPPHGFLDDKLHLADDDMDSIARQSPNMDPLSACPSLDYSISSSDAGLPSIRQSPTSGTKTSSSFTTLASGLEERRAVGRPDQERPEDVDYTNRSLPDRGWSTFKSKYGKPSLLGFVLKRTLKFSRTFTFVAFAT